jgi:hypothetical protein
MFGLFGKKPTIHKVEAEAVATVLAERIEDMSSSDFLANASNLVRETCERTGIFEELRNNEYKEICQLAIRFKEGRRDRSTVDATLKSF